MTVIKNIAILLVCLTSYNALSAQPKITVHDLSPSSIKQLHEFSKNNPEGFTIHIVPEKKWLATMTSFVTTPFNALRNSLSFKNISLTLISGALSLGWITYLLCAYVIYKTYRVIKNVHSWVNWCSDDDLLSDYDALCQKLTIIKDLVLLKKSSL